MGTRTFDRPNVARGPVNGMGAKLQAMIGLYFFSVQPMRLHTHAEEWWYLISTTPLAFPYSSSHLKIHLESGWEYVETEDWSPDYLGAWASSGTDRGKSF